MSGRAICRKAAPVDHARPLPPSPYIPALPHLVIARFARARSGQGYEERFPPTGLSAGYGFRKETIAGMRRNGRDAPIPDLRGTEIERQGSTLCGSPSRPYGAVASRSEPRMQHNLDLIRVLEEELFKQSVRGSPKAVSNLLADSFVEFGRRAACMKRRRSSGAWLQNMSSHQKRTLPETSS